MVTRTIPESTKTSLHQRLLARARQRWPALADVHVRFRGRFAYIDGELSSSSEALHVTQGAGQQGRARLRAKLLATCLASGEVLPLHRLRYAGSASLWGFAIYLASRDGYEDSILPSGLPVGSPVESLDCACGLYLADPSAWT
jgi:hypothetical protein